MATCPTLDLTDNFLLTNRHKYSGEIFMNYAAARAETQKTIEQFNVQPGHARNLAQTLSGGNLQKLVVGREFHSHPRLIIAENPTQGLDVASTREVWERLLAARAYAGIVLVTGELSEALELADRVAVMYCGRFMDVFSPRDKNKVERIGLMMAGVS
jgi:simple sugar transport system ATP-binding protein